MYRSKKTNWVRIPRYTRLFRLWLTCNNFIAGSGIWTGDYFLSQRFSTSFLGTNMTIISSNNNNFTSNLFHTRLAEDFQRRWANNSIATWGRNEVSSWSLNLCTTQEFRSWSFHYYLSFWLQFGIEWSMRSLESTLHHEDYD